MSETVEAKDQLEQLASELYYGTVPEIRLSEGVHDLSYSELHACTLAVREFRDLLVTVFAHTDGGQLVDQTHRRYTDVLFERALELALREDEFKSEAPAARWHFSRLCAWPLRRGTRR